MVDVRLNSVYNCALLDRGELYFLIQTCKIYVASGFTKLLAIIMRGVLTVWASNIQHWFPVQSTSNGEGDFFEIWRDSYFT